MIDMRNVEPGFRVVSSDGNEIGTIANCARQYCEVNTGILGLGHPLYVPMDAIRQTEGNTVFLDVPSDRIGELNWEHPPAGATEACPTGLYGTMPERPATPTAQTGEATGTPAAAAGQAPATPPPSVNELTPSTLASVQEGWPVICAEGKQVGTVSRARPDGLVMERGWFIFRHDVVVPAQAIERIDEVQHRVDLAVGCAAVNQFHSA